MKFATLDDTKIVAQYLYDMYMEVDPVDTKDNFDLFLNLATDYIIKDFVIFDNRGFFIMKDETPIVKKTKIWNGVAVYIKPKFRKGKTLKEFYTFMFINFKGSIMGYTEANSEHNKVLLKRHKLLGYVYEMYRS